MIKFKYLSQNARIWVYTSNRLFSDHERDTILTQGQAFVSTWSAHGDKLKAAIDILDNCFLVIGVDQDETSASGCSIDASIIFLQGLEVELDLSLLDWNNIAFSEKNHIRLMKRADFENALKDDSIDADALIYQTNLKLKSDLQTKRTVPLSESNFKNLLIVKS